MCGITGWIDHQRDLLCEGPTVAAMNRAQQHRGPDAHGQWLSPHAALAHQRLIVIDPTSGAQPMIHTQGDQTFAITYNGEIYNYRELRWELVGLGHQFQTCSDTEVLLHAYMQWGEDCVHHLNGIFAFAIWDESRRRLLLARDRLGVKPLFYAVRDGGLLFGSELKSLLAHQLVKPRVSASGLAEILTFVRTPGSGIYCDVNELPPAHLATFDQRGLRVRRYWQVTSAPHEDDLATTVERIRALLEDTVKRQLIADVPVACLLSGGLDSSGVTALAAREVAQHGERLSTYSIDFVDSAAHFHGTPLHPSLDAPWVERMADWSATRHQTVRLDPSMLVNAVLSPLFAYDFPTAGQMTSSMGLLFETVKHGATVALSGEGADEVFGGYPWFFYEPMLTADRFPWLSAFGPVDSHLEWLSPELVQTIQPGEHIRQEYCRDMLNVPRLAGENARESRLREMFYMNLTRFLPFLLERKDRMSMAHGLEVRVPFCDHRLVEYMWNVPMDIKAVDAAEKGILRRAFEGLLPDDVRTRKKSAYPTAQDPAYHCATRAMTVEIANDRSAPVQALIAPEAVRALAQPSENQNQGVQLVSVFERIIQLNAWLEQYHVELVL